MNIKILSTIALVSLILSCNSNESANTLHEIVDNEPSISETNNTVEDEVNAEPPVTESISREIAVQNTWKRIGTVDEFGKESGESVIGAEFHGTMSNSATTNSPLVIQSQLADGQIVMRFLEYGRQPADIPNSKFIEVSVRKSNAQVVQIGQFFFSGFMVDSGYLPGSNTLAGGDGRTKDNQLLDILLSETEPITVRVEMRKADRYNSAVYIFDMDNSGLVELM